MPSTSVREIRSEDGAVLLDVEQGLCFGLNALGSAIWALLKKGYTVDLIATELGSQYAVPRSELVRDIHDFIRELESKKVLLHPAERDDDQGFFHRLRSRCTRSD